MPAVERLTAALTAICAAVASGAAVSTSMIACLVFGVLVFDDVSVCVDSKLAEALIQRAGIPELTNGHWRVAPGRHETSIGGALSAALLKLATGGAHAAS